MNAQTITVTLGEREFVVERLRIRADAAWREKARPIIDPVAELVMASRLENRRRSRWCGWRSHPTCSWSRWRYWSACWTIRLRCKLSVSGRGECVCRGGAGGVAGAFFSA
jgi:hypothetical protein